MTDFTRDWIAKREQLEKAATEGPWFQGRSGRRYESDRDVYSKREPDEEGSHDIATYVWSTEDAEFIADARTSLPAALAALRVVVELHRPDDEDLCRSCYGVAYPCLAVAAIEAELRSES